MVAIRKHNISVEELRRLLDYNPETGVFRWRVLRGGNPAGSRAGGVHHTGYLVIKISGQAYGANRIAWAVMTGQWPDLHVDHRDNDRSNNRWRNLRLATHGQNRANSRANGSAALKGVSRRGVRWIAQISANGVQRYLGIYDTAEEAHAAYAVAARQLHGEFARMA